MTTNLTLPSEHDASDLRVFLERAAKLGCEHVRLIGAGPVLAAYVGVLVPSGLLDTAPTVLGLRVFERAVEALGESGAGADVAAAGADAGAGALTPLDTVVTIRGMLDRLARPELTFALPVGEAGIAWAGVSAPRSGWEPVGLVSASDLEAIARAGIEEIAGSNGLGTIIVTRARREVWGRPIFSGASADASAGAGSGAESESESESESGSAAAAAAGAESGAQAVSASLVSGAAFAAFGLGFLGEDEPVLSRSAKWMRLTTARGHILVR